MSRLPSTVWPALALILAPALVSLFMSGAQRAFGVAAVAGFGVVLVLVRALVASYDTGRPDVEAALRDLDARFADAAGARLKMRLRAETAGRFREEFVAAVRHELNTPLNAILGFTDLLLQDVDGPLTPQQREDVQAIRSAGAYLRELVQAVLAEWAPDRTTPLPVMPVDLVAVAKEVARLLEGQVLDAELELRVQAVGEPVKPVADARRIRQLLINLGTNAIRATSRGSVTFEVAPHEEGVRLTVRDTGTGIPKERIPRLFVEFEQGDDPVQHRGGTGLGLALTRDLVEWHGGRIEVESELGKGSAFHVILPEEPE